MLLEPAKKRIMDRFPDNYDKKAGSNFDKTVDLLAGEIQVTQDVYERMAAWRNIDAAEGAALDQIGARYGQQRGQATDNVYRVMIRAKIKQNTSGGRIDDIIDFVSFVLQIDPTEVDYKEEYPAKVHINVPIDAITRTGLTMGQFSQLVDLVGAGGVKIQTLFEGTFAFADDYDSSGDSDDFGFADDAQTVGGTLGAAFDPADDYDLPI